MRYIYIFLILNSFLFANDILNIKHDDNFYNIGTHLGYYVDKNDKLSIDKITKKEFRAYHKTIANFGFLSSTYWFKLKFSYDKSMLDKKWLFSIENPLLNYVDLYVFNANKQLILHKKSGNLNTKSKLYEDIFLFDLPNASTEVFTLYVRIKTSGSMFVPMRIINAKALLKNTHLHQTLSGLYYGILFVLILYNLITFLYTREKVYALYVMFVISYALWQLSFDGLGTRYLWSNNYWMIEKGTTFFIYTSMFSLLVFSQILLKAKINIPNI
ncbi:MAG: histidine kinase, partial [Epsilonproteobacteria bacterium]|nr:histidine kinase [Campylobacterota bacterium]